ncbi:TPA: hypothetical protein HA265_01150 [Candidatus Woesearchaeota archaeon]|nr:hypothetical protein [Candidatus Woesearchaeota archaeon]
MNRRNVQVGDFVKIVKAGGGQRYACGGETFQMPLGSVGVVRKLFPSELSVVFPTQPWRLEYDEVCKVEMKEVSEDARKESVEQDLKEAEQVLKELIAQAEVDYELEQYRQTRKNIIEKELGNLRKAGLEQEEIDQLLADKGLEHILKAR